jgi:hypothetical protein
MPLRRPLIALFCAPILPALVPAWFSYANRTYHPVSAFVFFWGILCVIQLGIGIPAFRLFNRLKLKGILAYLLLGFFAVYIPAFALCLYQWSERNYELGTGSDRRGSQRWSRLITRCSLGAGPLSALSISS